MFGSFGTLGKQIFAHIYADSIQPGGKAAVLLKSRQEPEHPQKDLLGGVHGIFGIAQIPQGQIIDFAFIGRDQLRKSGIVAGLCPLYQFSLGEHAITPLFQNLGAPFRRKGR